MHTETSKLRARRAANIAALFGTASLFALAPGAAHAAAAAVEAAPVEEVLITGSLIRGAPAVGVPVTAVGQEEFHEAGALTISEMLRNVPSIEGNESVGTVVTSGANRQRLQNAEIHGQAFAGQATTTLIMVNGHRYPAQGTNLENTDPSIIPQLAIQRIDVLAAGASATYGSDAVAGVINIILKRNYNGAITQFQVGMSTDLGWESRNIGASQLFGRTWDNLADLGPGGLTLTYEWYDRRPVIGPGRDYYTVDFEPFGFDNRTPLASNIPGVVSFGTTAALANPNGTGLAYSIPATRASGAALSSSTGDRYCNNCYSIPAGSGWDFGSQAPGPTATWSAVLANKGVNNQRSPYEFAWMNPAQQGNHAVLVLDQQLLDDVFGLGPVDFFADAFYMSRRSQNAYIPGWSPCARCHTVANGVTVPTHNPYRPAGAPQDVIVRAHFSLGDEFIPKSDAGSISAQFAVGLNFNELPYDWTGSLFFSSSEETSWAYTRNMVNVNMFNAAMGNTIASVAPSGSAPGHAAFTKPANVPFLNPFCDSTLYRCNSPQTLAYIRAARDDFSEYEQREFGANISGPIYELPGGMIQVALGAQKLTQHFFFRNPTNENTFHTEIVADSRQYNKQLSGAVFGQINVPLISEEMGIPLIKSALLELGYRYDHYYELGGVKTPKIAGNWDLGYGFVMRGAYGQSFNAPPFGLISNYSGVRETHEMYNVAGSRSETLSLNCPAHAAVNIPQGFATAGSLQAYLNPTRIGCPDPDGTGPLTAGPAADTANLSTFTSRTQPVGINIGSSILFLQGVQLQPETSDQWSLGFNFTPQPDDAYTGFLAGLSVDVSWWHVQRENLIDTISVGAGVNDPNSFDPTTPDDVFQTRYQVIPRPDLLLTAPENAEFKARVDEIIATGKASFDPAAIPFIKFIEISSLGNRGWHEAAGIDFDVRYDWDMGNWGAMNFRVSGYYETRNRQQALAEDPIESDYTQVRREDGLIEGANSGHQMQRMRFNLGWTDGFFSVVSGATWRPHTFGNNVLPPACFWHMSFSGPGSCYPGSPYYEQPVFTTPDGHIGPDDQRYSGQLQPSQMFFDLAFAYDTGDSVTNPYLQNLRLGLNINNILNRLPGAINYDPRTSSGSPRIREGNDFQRTIALTVTKTW